MKLSNCFRSKLILKISQGKRFRDPKCGCSFESFVFIKCRRALPGEGEMLHKLGGLDE